MISINDEGHIIVELKNTSYDISSKQYTDFLLWITSPERDVQIDADDFRVSDSLSDTDKQKAERYSKFLTDFIKKRELKLSDLDRTIPSEMREKEINDFIEKLKQQSKTR